MIRLSFFTKLCLFTIILALMSIWPKEIVTVVIILLFIYTFKRLLRP